MEYNLVKPRHGLTECRLHFTASDHDYDQGLLDIVDRTQVQRFNGKCYSVTTPINDVVKLYRLHIDTETGSPVSETGQYWSPVGPPPDKYGRADRFDRPSRRTDRHDIPYTISSSDERCKDTAEDILIVPKGILLYEGLSTDTLGNKDKTWQIFIPKIVVTPLLRYQRELVSGKMTDVRRQFLLDKIDKIQTQLMTEWTKKYLSNMLSGKKFDIAYLLVKGNNTENIPGEIRKLLPAFLCGMMIR